MADDKKSIREAAPPAEAPAPAVENAAVPEQAAPEPVLTDAEAVMLEHEGQAALFEMGEAVPDPADAVTHAEVEEPAAPGKDDPAPAHSGKVVDFAAARNEAAKEEKKAIKQKPPKEKGKAAKPGKGRPPKTEKTAPEQTKPPKAGKTHAAPEEKAAPPAPEVPPTPRDATRGEKEEIVYGAWLGAERQPSYKEQLRLAINETLAKRPADFDAFLRLMEASGFMVKRGRGGTISFLVPGQERATRLRASTLGDGYDPEDIKAVIAGERPIPEQPVPVSAAPRRVNLIVDIQERLRSGKGAAYARWAKVYNLKQMAAALQFMQEQNITEYDQLSAKAEDAVSRFHALTEQLRRTEADLSVTFELMGAVVQYAKTRPVFDGYKATKYSRKYLAEHEAELADYRAAKATMGELLGGEKLPKMAELKEKRRQLAARKKALYTEYRSAQEEMRQAVAVKANIDHLLGVTDGQHKKEQER